MTYFTPESTSFCATATPFLASHWSSSEMTSNFRVLPPTLILRALSSSAARRTPLSLSRPAKVLGPERGPLWPILTICSCAKAEAAQAMAAAATRGDFREGDCIANVPVRVAEKSPGRQADSLVPMGDGVWIQTGSAEPRRESARVRRCLCLD